MTALYLEIQQSVHSGVIVSLSTDRLAQFSAALARPQAYTHFSAPEFPQVCETVRMLLTARLNENVANAKNGWHSKPIGMLGIGVFIVIISAFALYLLSQYLGISL